MLIGETILLGVAAFAMFAVHILVLCGHVIFIPAIIGREMDSDGWGLYLVVWCLTILLIGFWCFVFGI